MFKSPNPLIPLKFEIKYFLILWISWNGWDDATIDEIPKSHGILK